MTDPSRRQQRDETARRNLKYGFVVVIGISTGLIGLQGGATPVQMGALILVGALVGVGLLAYFSWTSSGRS